jgi:hypothetical protein
VIDAPPVAAIFAVPLMWVSNGMLYDATSDTLPVCEAELTVKLSRAKIPADTLHDIVLSLIHIEVSKEDASLEAFEEYDLKFPSRDPDDWQPKKPKDFPIINKLIAPEDAK